MIDFFLWGLVFIVALFALIKASDYFTDSAEKIGIYFGIPAFIVGVTIVALGTSLPEIVSSIFAVLRNSSEIVAGNAIGSNIANIFLVLGIVALVSKKLKIKYELINVDLPFLVGSALLLTLLIMDGVFGLADAILSLLCFVVYMLYAINVERTDKELLKEMKIKRQPLKWQTWFILFLSAFFIYIGAKYTIDAVINLSEILNLGKEIIAISAVALGTSLPELAVSVTAARKGKPEIAIGNILGSNIANALVVMGLPALIGVLVIPQNILAFGLPLMLIATFMYFIMIKDKEITKWEGWLLLIFYAFFIGKLFGLF